MKAPFRRLTVCLVVATVPWGWSWEMLVQDVVFILAEKANAGELVFAAVVSLPVARKQVSPLPTVTVNLRVPILFS